MKWLCLVLALATAVQAQEGGQPQRGLNSARANCASCHAVGRGERSSPNPLAPPFQRVAEVPGMTPIAVSHMMHSVHKTMPLIILPPDEEAHIAAYILSLRSR